ERQLPRRLSLRDHLRGRPHHGRAARRLVVVRPADAGRTRRPLALRLRRHAGGRGAPQVRRRHAVRRVAAFALWLGAVLVAAEGAVRAAGWVLRRDQSLAPGHAGANVIYAIGDSFTYGQGVTPEEAWPRLLASRLRAELGDAAPTVRTLAEPGRSSSV